MRACSGRSATRSSWFAPARSASANATPSSGSICGPADRDSGGHLCLRARSREEVDAFHAAGLALGGSDDGPPGPREHDEAGQIYYAAFIRDPDGNRIEAVSFIAG
jgi:catechol 2,3-dioxygenase-like lactoylglutathione lyase family enzyme